MRALGVMVVVLCGCDASQSPSDGLVGAGDAGAPLDFTVAAATCADAVRDQDESDVDCGGASCAPCVDGKLCGGDADCVHALCVGGACSGIPTCSDGHRDGDETDADCGGAKCSPCGLGLSCRFNVDCTSRVCKAGRCAAARVIKPTFAAPVDTPLPYGDPQRLAVADFDGDQHLDVLVSDYAGYVQLARGHGDGTLFSPLAFASGGAPATGLCAGDFNEDGLADAAVVNERTNAVAVLLGTKNGLGAPTLVVPGGQVRAGIGAGDFDGDGHLDVVVSVDSSFAAFFGDGAGRFQMAHFGDGGAEWIVPADLNGDGRRDFVAYAGLAEGFVAGANRVITGSWAGPMINAAPTFLAVGDLDGDGRTDVVTLDPFGSLQVSLGQGNGMFRSNPTVKLVIDTGPIAIADFNLDGWQDIAVGGRGTSGTFALFLGDGKGGIQSQASFAGPVGAQDLAVGDFNGDGKPDLAVAAYHGAGKVTILVDTTP